MKQRHVANAPVCLSLLAALVFGCTGDSTGAPSLPNIPEAGRTSADFVPSGWTVFKDASGDLNADGMPDVAMILTKPGDNPESGYSGTGFATSLRPLVVLFKQTEGSYKRAAVSPGAVMNGAIANNFALSVVELHIKNGNIELETGNSATDIEDFTTKFRLQHGKFELIGMTDDSGFVRTGSSRTDDHNLNTGFSVVDINAPDQNAHYSFYRLRAGFVPSDPDTSQKSPTNWPGPAVKLVSRNKENHNKTSAELRGVHTKQNLFLCARVLNPANQHGSYTIRLAGAKKKFFSPAETHGVISGEVTLYARFPLSELKSLRQQSGGRVPSPNDSIAASVQILDSAGNVVLSTSTDGDKHEGAIALTRSPELPTLSNFDWANRDD